MRFLYNNARKRDLLKPLNLTTLVPILQIPSIPVVGRFLYVIEFKDNQVSVEIQS